MKVYKCIVPTTSSSHDTFYFNGEYYACRNSAIYVVARDIHHAAEQIDIADTIEEVGECFEKKKYD